MHLTYTTLIITTMVTYASAALRINNWCSSPAYLYINRGNGDCDRGPNGVCFQSTGYAPYTIPPHGILSVPLKRSPVGTSIKIGRSSGSDFQTRGIIQYEYTLAATALFWDLSHIDGAGVATTGNPWHDQNVKVTPTGKGVGSNEWPTCRPIKCPKGQVCTDAYLKPNDVATKVCPDDTGDMWLDLCMDGKAFAARAEGFVA